MANNFGQISQKILIVIRLTLFALIVLGSSKKIELIILSLYATVSIFILKKFIFVFTKTLTFTDIDKYILACKMLCMAIRINWQK